MNHQWSSQCLDRTKNTKKSWFLWWRWLQWWPLWQYQYQVLVPLHRRYWSFQANLKMSTSFSLCGEVVVRLKALVVTSSSKQGRLAALSSWWFNKSNTPEVRGRVFTYLSHDWYELWTFYNLVLSIPFLFLSFFLSTQHRPTVRTGRSVRSEAKANIETRKIGKWEASLKPASRSKKR